MADATGGMFEARLALRDDASEPIGDINENIEKAIGSSEDLQKGLKGMESRLDRMAKSTKKINDDTNKIGIIGAALLGTKGKGSIKDQMKGTKYLLGKFTNFIKDALIDTMFSLGDAALYAAEKSALLLQALKGHLFLAQFPRIALGAIVETVKLVGVIEELQTAQRLTTSEAASMGEQISSTMLNTAANIEKVQVAYKELAHLGQLNTKGVRDLADATVYMSEAWRMSTGELVQFNREIADLYQVGRGGILGVASAIDHVARSTAASREELMGLVKGLKEDLLYKIPRDMRSKVMPRMIADITAIAGEWANVFGDAETVRKGFAKAIDVFDEEGQRLRAAIVGLGGATQEEMNKILGDKDAGGFFIAQVKAVQKLKKEMGDERFTQTASIWAQQMGLTREEFMKMSEVSVTAMEDARKATEAELKSTESLRNAWDKAKGVFNSVWQSLENIGQALLITIGEPLLQILTPAFEWLGKTLQKIVEFFQNWDDGTKKIIGFTVAIGALVSIFATLVPIITVVGGVIVSVLGVIATVAATAFGAFIALAGPLLLKTAAIAAALVVVAIAAYDLGKAFLEGFAPALDKIWTMLKAVSFVLLAVFAPALVAIGLIIASVIKYWDEFYDAMKPGIDAISFAWNELKNAFREFGTELAKMFDDGGKGTIDFSKTLATVMKEIAKHVGFVIRLVAHFISGLLVVAQVLVDVLKAVITPIIRVGLAVWDVFSGIISIVVEAIQWVLTFFGFMSGNTSAIGDSLVASLKKFIGGIITLLLTPFDIMTDAINMVIDAINRLPGIDIGNIPSLSGTVKQLISLETGGITKEDTPAMLHANEAVIPLEKLPQVASSVVNVNQDAVVEELRAHRIILERIYRSGGFTSVGRGG